MCKLHFIVDKFKNRIIPQKFIITLEIGGLDINFYMNLDFYMSF